MARTARLRFAQRWLIAVNCLSIVLGFALAFASSSAVLSFYRRSLAEVFWGASTVPEASAAYFDWSMALIGAATIGWAVTNLFIVTYALGRGERWALVAIALGTLSWVGLETVVSLAAGARAETTFVLAAAAAVLVPVAIAWPETRPVDRHKSS